MKSKVLIVEDNPASAELYAEFLRHEPWEIALAGTGAEAIAYIDRHLPQILLLDLHLPDMNGLAVLDHIGSRGLPTSAVVITAHGSIKAAVDAMRAGAYDFIVKPFNAERVIYTLRNALERQKLQEMVDILRDDMGRRHYCGFIGKSLAMQAIYRIIDAAAPSRATVFITGESGTGKELCAEALHRRSRRAAGPFIALNCGAIPHDLIESEIFGHVRGAFTGAVAEREGAASQADGGTLFLDEICEMDLSLQTKLLRFLQTGSFQKVGGSRQQKVDIRVVCATNRNPLEEVAAGRFREDLYYRLHVIPIHIPPLREREDDVADIAEGFLIQAAAEEGKAFDSFSEEAKAVLRGYDWPGNVRQLQNIVRNVVVLNEGPMVTAAMLPPPLAQIAASCAPVAGGAASAAPIMALPGGRPLWQIERDAIEQTIASCQGNILKAAAVLEISSSTIYRKRQSWEQEESARAHP